MRSIDALLATSVLGLTLGVGCASHPAAPFDTLKNSGATMLRLQNYEPPAQQPQGAAAVPGLPNLIPPQIQQWAQQAAPALQQLLPPGLLPPGLLPTSPLPMQQQATQEFRFHERRVLGTAQVAEADLREQLAELLGDEDNFQLEHQPCNYAELGLGWATQANVPPYEILISFSCNNIQAAQGFSWPHATGIGMKPKLVEGLTKIVQQLFPTTTMTPTGVGYAPQNPLALL
jgi:hypothetical protein